MDAFAVIREEREASLCVRVAGVAPAVARLVSAISTRGGFVEVDAPWATIVRPPGGTLARVSVPPGREAEVVPKAGALLAYPGAGVVYVSANVDALRALRSRAEAMGGALVLERGTPEEKRALGVWGAVRSGLAVMRALKQRFDPHDVLAPGRLPV